MLTRVKHYFTARDPEDAPIESYQLEKEGYVVLRQIFSDDEVTALQDDIKRVFDELGPDCRTHKRPIDHDDMYRYEMFNQSTVCQEAIAHSGILGVIEPLLGEDCHVIANTAWRNPANHPSNVGGDWHIDAGPHIPLPEGVAWPASIPHPVFAIGVHIFLQDCRREDGPTGVIPSSHLSGRFPPPDKTMDDDLTYGENQVDVLTGKTGDVGMFVSDVWHRRMPATKDDRGRFFLQVHYGRRDIAQRVRPTTEVNHLSDIARLRAVDARQRTIVGLHPNNFYDG